LNTTQQTAWNIYRNGRKIDTVYYINSMTAQEVKKSLENHDGYPPDITVQKG
jgi:hypothetical protein